MGTRIILCIFGEEKNQEALICFLGVYVCGNVFGGERIRAKNVQVESKIQEILFFWSGGAWGLLWTQHALRGGAPCRAATCEAPQMWLILTPLERS